MPYERPRKHFVIQGSLVLLQKERVFAMLSKIENTDFRQVMVRGSRVKSLFHAIEDLNEVALNRTGSCVLILYDRLNPPEINEAGIYFGPGPFWDCWDSFPLEMLRLFSRNDKVFNLVGSHYDHLVKKQCFRYVDPREINCYD